MTHIKSPFIVVDDFISPASCERIIKEYGITVPSVETLDDETTRPLKHSRILRDGEFMLLLKAAVQEHLQTIQERYGADVAGMEPPVFSQYFEDQKNPCELHGCENAKYVRKKWLKVKDVDLVGYIWLKDYNNGVPLDPSYEVYGGKLEFPAFNFSLIPQRGMLVLFPAGPHFITAISPVMLGTLEQIKITIKLRVGEDGLWFYQPADFPGTYQEWFAEE
jgi:hypothetical protein